MTTWLNHVQTWKNCQRCPLAQQRDRICLARAQKDRRTTGPLPCDVVFVGEAPGMSEDALGRPFVGPAGFRMDDIIERSLPQGVTYALTNLVACFPREAKEKGDNEPERGEILECRPRLVEFMNIAQPRLIVRVGKLVEQYLNFDLSVPMVDIVHPAWILRQVLVKQQNETNRCIVQVRNAWQDVAREPKRTWTPWGQMEKKRAKQQRPERDEPPF